MRVNGTTGAYTTSEIKAELALLNTVLLKVPRKKNVKAAKTPRITLTRSSSAEAAVDVRK